VVAQGALVLGALAARLALAAAPRRGAAPPPATARRAVEDPGKLPPVELMEDD
jgi:hypothetical protein